MSGASNRYVYNADNGTAYAVRIPVWEANVTNHAATLTQSAVLATTQPNLPKGVRRRKRFFNITATNKEGSFTVLSASSNLWTTDPGAALTIPGFNVAPPAADNALLRGATGERRKAI